MMSYVGIQERNQSENWIAVSSLPIKNKKPPFHDSVYAENVGEKDQVIFTLWSQIWCFRYIISKLIHQDNNFKKSDSRRPNITELEVEGINLIELGKLFRMIMNI